MECIRTFFRRRFNYESKLYPRFKSTLKDGLAQDGVGFRLDVVVAASGFKKSDQKALEEVRRPHAAVDPCIIDDCGAVYGGRQRKRRRGRGGTG